MHHPRDPPDSESWILCQRIWNLPTRPGKQEQGWNCHPCKKYYPLHWNSKIQSKWHRISWSRICPARPPLASFQHLPTPPPPPPPLPAPLTSYKPIALHLIQPTTENGIIMEDFNSHSPSWGYDELDSKREEVECWATNQQLILINKPQDPPTFYSRNWRTTSTPDLAFATNNIHKLCHREVCSQLRGSDHRPVTILVDQKTPVSAFKRAPSWNYKRAYWDSFKQLADEECMGLQLSEENMNRNAAQFNIAILRAAKKSIPRWRKRNYNPFWTPRLEQLQEAVNRAKEDIERNPSDQNTAEYSKARAEFSREKLLQTRTQWYEKTASLNLEKDSSKLWSLTQVLNEEAPSRSKTVLRVHNMLLTDKRAANEFAQLYRRESTLPLTPKKVGDMKEKLKQEEKQENVPSPCLNSTLKISELNSAIRNLKPKKAPGPDGVSNDMLKHLGPIARKKRSLRPSTTAGTKDYCLRYGKQHILSQF